MIGFQIFDTLHVSFILNGIVLLKVLMLGVYVFLNFLTLSNFLCYEKLRESYFNKKIYFVASNNKVTTFNSFLFYFSFILVTIMTRKKVKLSSNVNDASIKATYNKRKNGVLNKVDELSTFCGIEACAIVYGPYEPQLEI
jgi:hypothetical protein